MAPMQTYARTLNLHFNYLTALGPCPLTMVSRWGILRLRRRGCSSGERETGRDRERKRNRNRQRDKERARGRGRERERERERERAKNVGVLRK